MTELLKRHCPDQYVKYCSADEPFQDRSLPIVLRHDEIGIFGGRTTGTVDQVFVQMDIAPAASYFRRLNDRALIANQLPVLKNLPTATLQFLQWFSEPSTDISAGPPAVFTTSISQIPSFDGDAVTARHINTLRQLHAPTVDQSPQELSDTALHHILSAHRHFENAMRRLDNLFGDDLLSAGDERDSTTRFPLHGVSPFRLTQLRHHVLILGQPGAGKTFQAKATYKQALANNIPTLFYPCAAYRPTLGSLLDNIAHFWKQHTACDLSLITSQVEASNSLLVFDGLDEIVTSRPEFITYMRQLAEEYPHLVICATCRSSVALPSLESYYTVELDGFTPAQLEQFFSQWFTGTPNKFQSIMDFLKSHEPIRRLASSPMVATILATLHEHDEELPSTFAKLYQARCDLLLDRWDRGKNIARNVFVKDDKMRVLTRLAHSIHQKRERFFVYNQYFLAFKEVLASVMSVDHAQAMFDELIVSNGIVVKETETLYSFGHLSNQEFLVAKYLQMNEKGAGLREVFFDTWWREVVRFYASMSGDLSHIISTLLKGNEAFIDKVFLRDVIGIAKYTSGPVTSYVQDDEFGLEDSDFEDEDDDEAGEWPPTFRGRSLRSFVDQLLIGDRNMFEWGHTDLLGESAVPILIEEISKCETKSAAVMKRDFHRFVSACILLGRIGKRANPASDILTRLANREFGTGETDLVAAVRDVATAALEQIGHANA